MNTKNFFGHSLETIDHKEILVLINLLKKNFPYLNTDSGEDISLDETMKAQKSPTIKSLRIQSKIRYPIYNNGSFKDDIYLFLNKNINKELNRIFNKLENEINKVYRGYIIIENILYNKIIALINFCENRREFSNLQIISRIKEISEILEDTYNFISQYLLYNFLILKNVFENFDNILNKKYKVKSLSLIFLLKYFELPNNELSYILLFKIIDEETLILSSILNKLKMQIKSNQNSIEYNIINTLDNNGNNDKLSDRNSNYFNDESVEEQNETLNAMLDLMDNYINKSDEACKKINNFNLFRVLYNNYYIFLKGNYNRDIYNREIFRSINTIGTIGDGVSSTNSCDLMAINSIMDEEVVIKYFLDKKTIEEFIDFFKEKLPTKYKINKFLIMLQSFQNYSIFPIIIFWYNDKDNNDTNKSEYIKKMCLFLISYNSGIFLSIILNFCLSFNKLSLKTLMILNNILLIISLSFPFFLPENIIQKYEYIIIISRLLIGISFSRIIEEKFLLNYEPKLLVIKSIKSFFSIKYISISIGILYTSLINIFLKDFDFSITFINDKLIKENKHELFFIVISVIIMIINLFLFSNIKNKDVFKNIENEKLLINRSDNTEIVKKSTIFESTSSEISKPIIDDRKSVLSYGKSKLISYKNRRKAKNLDKKYKLYSNYDNYEGINGIFEEVDEIIQEQNKCCSYINNITFGLQFVLICSIINNEILIFLIPLLLNDQHNEKTNIIIFTFPYFLGYISFKYRNIILNIIKYKISFLNIIIIFFLIFEMFFYILLIMVISLNKNYFIVVCFTIFISFFNTIIEIFIIYLMNLVIPIEKKIFSISLGKFIDICVFLFKIINYFFIYYINNPIGNSDYDYTKDNILFITSLLICIIEIIVFYIFNFRKKYNSFSRIMNKITYEN